MRNATLTTILPEEEHGSALRPILFVSGLLVAGVIIWQAIATSGNSNPFSPSTNSTAAVLDIGVLVFREGLECVLVLAAITAGMTRSRRSSRHPIAIGAGTGFIATFATWIVAVHVMDDIGQSISALALQAATGLLAVIVLLVVMNWFFHKVYWAGWIAPHNRRRRDIVELADSQQISRLSLFWGMAMLGFTSLYREGFEVVLFLQSYRLRLGDEIVLWEFVLEFFSPESLPSSPLWHIGDCPTEKRSS